MGKANKCLNFETIYTCLKIQTLHTCLHMQTLIVCLHMKTQNPSPKSRPFRVRNAQDLGLAIKHFRMQAGLTQAELAERSGLHRSYLASLEGGRVTEAVDRLMTLFNELGVRITLNSEE